MNTFVLDDYHLEDIQDGLSCSIILPGLAAIVPGLLTFVSSDAGQPRSVLVDVNRTSLVRLQDLDEQDAFFQGFEQVDDLLEDLLVYYPDLNLTDLVTVVLFEVTDNV